MKATTQNDIQNVPTAISAPQGGEVPIIWRKNHGKFIHEDLYKQFNEDNLKQTNELITNVIEIVNNANLLIKTALNDLGVDLDSEITRATNRENEIEQEVKDETARATKAESDLNIKITDESARAKTAEEGLNTAISQEQARALSAEKGNSEAIAKLSSDINSKLTDLNTQISNIESRLTALENKGSEQGQ